MLPGRRCLSIATLIVFAGLAGLPGVAPVAAASLAGADPSFTGVWQRTDQLVANGTTTRSWFWGPQANSAGFYERYLEAPNAERLVQYFDKGRMEINNPDGDTTSPWFVTSGLLDRELISGQIQIGDARWLNTGSGANIPVAGDPDNAFPTYADLASLIDHGQPDETGTAETSAYLSSGTGSHPEAAGDPEAQLTHYVTYTGTTGAQVGYNIPRAFWDFMNQAGPVTAAGGTQQASPLFDWVFVLGWPIADPFWTQVRVAGVTQWVLVQPFERRLLTYTPANPDGWKVEMGNIGLHYQRWRYANTPAVPSDTNLPYFAMQAGNYWDFATSTGTDEIWTSLGPSRSFLGGSQLIARSEKGPNGNRTTYWAVTADSLDLYGYDTYDSSGKLSDTVVYWPPINYLPASTPYVGSSWSTQSTVISSSGPPHAVSMSFQVNAYEHVSTPAGIFTAWKLNLVVWDATDPAHPVQQATKLWFAPGTGTVQWLVANYSAELRSVTIVPPP